MIIKSKSHAIEILRDLEKQGFIEHTWLQSFSNDKTVLKKIWKLKTKEKERQP